MKRLLLLAAFFISFYCYAAQPGHFAYNSPEQIEQILERSFDARVAYIHIYFSDIAGELRELIIPISQLEEAMTHGLKFDGSSVQMSSIFNSDMHLYLDSHSFYINPEIYGQPRTARIFCDVYEQENIPYLADARSLLKQAVLQAHDAGYRMHVGPEIEFFILQQNSSSGLHIDTHDYFAAEPHPQLQQLKIAIINTLRNHGIAVEKIHHEVAPGQYEISIHYADPVSMADTIMLAKHLIRQVVFEHGLTVTFMPKPFADVNGSGMHVHFSFTDAFTGQNLFFDADHDAYLSHFGQQCVTGLLATMRQGAAISNSTINSYKRLIPGYEAPMYLCWSKTNRSALIRIPQFSVDQPQAARAELRCADACCNPYALFVLMLRSCMRAIEQNIDPVAPHNENMFALSLEEITSRNITVLPSDLQHALFAFSMSHVMREIFGDRFVDAYNHIKSYDVLGFKQSVTNWEWQRYLSK